MSKSKIAFIIACLAVTGAIAISFSAVTSAYYEKTKVLQNESSEDVLVQADQANYRNVTYTVWAKPYDAVNDCVYLYDEGTKRSVKMSPVEGDDPLYRVTYLTKIGDFNYRYFIADKNNPDDLDICEENNAAAHRTLEITSTSSEQEDRWHCKVIFKIEYDCHGANPMKVGGNFGSSDSWELKNMYQGSGNNWSLSWVYDQYINGNGSEYDYKYYTLYNNIKYEGGNNRSLWSTLGSTVSSYCWGQLICNDSWR